MSDKRTGYVNSGEARIYYEIYGSINDSPPIVCLHGNGEDSHCFDRQIADFRKYHPLILIDSRSHGRSTRGLQPLTIDLIARDVANVLRELSVKRAHMLGFSDGANAAISFAMHFEDYLESLILVGGNLSSNGVKFFVQFPIVLSYGLTSFLCLFSKNARAKKEILALMVKYPNFSKAQISEIKVPTLVLAGKKDMIKEKHTRMIASIIPEAKLEIIPGGDHFILQKKPEQVNPIILDFLATYNYK